LYLFSVDGEGLFIARRRHLTALQQALSALQAGYQSALNHEGIELIAEQLTFTQHHLATVTGQAITADDLLGEIFSRLCIGK